MPAAIMKIHHNEQDTYPAEIKAEIFAAIGDIEHIDIWGQEILVAPFITSPFIGKGSTMVKGEKQQNEDKVQSKCFMVVKLGDQVEAACKKMGRKVPQVGNWYFADVKNTDDISIRGIGGKPAKDPKNPMSNTRPWGDAGWPCRFILVADIRGEVRDRPQDVM